MVQEELGLKHQCQKCDALFYDLNKSPIICPACGITHDVEAARKLQRAQAMINEENTAEEGDDLLAVVDDDDEIMTSSDDDTIIEDTSDLDSGDDDIGVDINTNDDDEN